MESNCDNHLWKFPFFHRLHFRILETSLMEFDSMITTLRALQSFIHLHSHARSNECVQCSIGECSENSLAVETPAIQLLSECDDIYSTSNCRLYHTVAHVTNNFQRSPSNYSTAIFFFTLYAKSIRTHSSVPVCPVHIVQFSVSVFSHCLSTVNFQLILIPIYCKFYLMGYSS